MAELPYVCAYFNWLEAAETLNDSERGRLYTALIRYAMTGEVEEFRGNEKFVFHALKWTIDRDKKAYEDKCNQNSRNVNERYQKPTTEYDRIRPYYKKEKEKGKEKKEEKENIYNSPSESKEKPHRKVDEVVSFFNEICVSFPSVRALSDKRKASITALLGKYSFEDIRTVFKKAEASSFLKGKDGKWSATFDWLISDTNFAKVLDGNFDDKTAPKKSEVSTAESEEAFEMSWAIVENELRKKGVS